MRRTDPLILGGGPAGAAAAIVLASAGAKPVVLERRKVMTGAVCGGFLSWDTLAGLRALGIDVGALGARPIETVRIHAGKRVAHARLPKAAMGLSRVALDSALLQRAAELGAAVEHGVTVRRVADGKVDLADGSTFVSDALFVATGKHMLRGMRRDVPGAGAVGFRATIPVEKGLQGDIELHLFRGGYAGILLQEDGAANLCLSVSSARLRSSGGHIDRLLESLHGEAPRLLDRLAVLPDAWDTIADVPYGWRSRAGEAGRYRVGDQAAVVASLAGDGMGIAVASGRAAALAWLRGEPPQRYQIAFARRTLIPVAIAEHARRMAERPVLADRCLPLLARFPALTRMIAHVTRVGA